MTIKITTDSTCDLPRRLLEQRGITVAPLGITKGGKLYRDGEGITIGDIAARYSMSESAVKSNLHRTRLKLKETLEKEGVTV